MQELSPSWHESWFSEEPNDDQNIEEDQSGDLMERNASKTFVFFSKNVHDTICVLGFFLGLEHLFDTGLQKVQLENDPEKPKIEDNLWKREHHPGSKV